MSSSHARFQAMADRLIAKHGRTITLIKRSESLVDANKPWLGTSSSNNSATTLDKTAVFVDGDSGAEQSTEESGQQTRRSVSKFLVAGDNEHDLKEFEKIKDGNELYRITRAKLIRPGSVSILWEIEVEA